MNVKEYHAHLYYSEENLEVAKQVVEKAREFGLFSIGRIHERLVGPHPMWSCQLLFKNDELPKAMPWILENREGLIIFMHPDTGNDLEDHTDHAIWIGGKVDLNLEVFKRGN
ncbi:4,5-dioxygenase [Halobacteriovorax marinus]|uniref:4,5-dioxygenase n=1 Tax=Halobacteriovorax marinus (strain ATCC BAA-682 / DSM 15412 / SJ) TaxID=862908 RepID=E1WYW8_HALMS|nr:DOPA 4,5-dioxygenase family protein [Halobacteriovorax marinus]ATH07441.1 4,5-dioxygenase [Halobacteriovorax marinus]CBW26065.1 conserved hypothetical protein [Halobacteriovorax marinus SJ]